MNRARLILTAILAILFSIALPAQRRKSREESIIRLVSADEARQYTEWGTNYRLVKGRAKFFHNNTYLLCDSAIWNVDRRYIEAYGNVKIIQDKTQLTSEMMTYDIDENLARFTGNLVELKDKSGNLLRTRQMTYNTRDSVANFLGGGAMMGDDGKVIESLKGMYDSKAGMFQFEKNVEIYIDSIYMKMDDMIYLNEEEKALFGKNTHTWRDDGFIVSGGGWYDSRDSVICYHTDVYMMDPSYEAWAEEAKYFNATGTVEMKKNVRILDTADKIVLGGHFGRYETSTSEAMLTDNPAVIYLGENEKHEPDTLYMRGDTIRYWTVPKCSYTPEEIKQAEKNRDEMLFDAITTLREKQAEERAKKYEEEMRAAGKLPPLGSVADSLSKAGADSLSAGAAASAASAGDSLTQGATLSAGDALDAGEKPGVVDSLAKGEAIAVGEKSAVGDSLAKGEAIAVGEKPGVVDSLAKGEAIAVGEIAAAGDTIAAGPSLSELQDSLSAGAIPQAPDTLVQGASALTDSIAAGPSVPASADSLSAGAMPTDSLSAGAAPADSIPAGPADSTIIRRLRAYNNVKLFRSDTQAACDSMEFSELDSIAVLYGRPVLWNAIKNQLTSETMHLLLKDGQLHRSSMLTDARITSMQDSQYFNQIKSAEMMGFFRDNDLYRFDALGGVTAIFYMLSKGQVANVNLKEAKQMTAVIKDGEAKRLLYLEETQSDAYPVFELESDRHRLKGFEWRGEERPVDRYAITDLEIPETMREEYEGLVRPRFRETDRYFDKHMSKQMEDIRAKEREESRKRDALARERQRSNPQEEIPRPRPVRIGAEREENIEEIDIELEENIMLEYETPMGNLLIEPLGHGSVKMTIEGSVIYVDPYGEKTDFNGFPTADLILITHDHYDHYDEKALALVATNSTEFVSPASVQGETGVWTHLTNGDGYEFRGIGIRAVPAYNIEQMNDVGNPFHPRGEGNGYILDFGGFTVYIAGDTEFIPEMEELSGTIDVAFLPKNLPYTMSDEKFIEAANALKPKVLIPYHYFEIDNAALRRAVDPDILLIAR